MDYTVPANISPKAAARLILSNELDLSASWQPHTAEKVLHNLLSLPFDEILAIVDSNSYGDIAEIKHIPQFGRIETLFDVPLYFKESGNTSADYAQLGLFLKKDVTSSLGANTKFGENHGKVAASIGLAMCANHRITPSSITFAFCSATHHQQKELLRRLSFRIPIIQILLRAAKCSRVNGYTSMTQLSPSTQLRRGLSVRSFLAELDSCNHVELSTRIRNIYWNVD